MDIRAKDSRDTLATQTIAEDATENGKILLEQRSIAIWNSLEKIHVRMYSALYNCATVKSPLQQDVAPPAAKMNV